MKQAIISIRAVPNAKQTRCEGKVDGVYRLRLRALPEDGKANRALVEFLAESLSLRRSQITFLSGEKSREKTLRIEGRTEEEVERLLLG